MITGTGIRIDGFGVILEVTYFIAMVDLYFYTLRAVAVEVLLGKVRPYHAGQALRAGGQQAGAVAAEYIHHKAQLAAPCIYIQTYVRGFGHEPGNEWIGNAFALQAVDEFIGRTYAREAAGCYCRKRDRYSR